MNEPGSRVIYEFNGFRADPVMRRLYSGDDQLAVTPKAFDTLLVLIARRGNLVLKNDLIDAVWAETAVEENNLTQQIAALRRCFGEKAGDHRFIVTLPGKGYSFVAPVSETHTSEEVLVLEASRSTVTIDIASGFLSVVDNFFAVNGRLGASIAAVYIAVVCFAAFLPLVTGVNGYGRTQTVAVLSFRAADTDDAAFGAGIRDTLRARIGNLQDVELRPARYAVPPDDIMIAAREAGADVVLTGSVQRDGGRVRVAVEMVDVKHERVVWGRTFDCDDPNRFAAQDAIAGEVVAILAAPRFRKV